MVRGEVAVEVLRWGLAISIPAVVALSAFAGWRLCGIFGAGALSMGVVALWITMYALCRSAAED